MCSLNVDVMCLKRVMHLGGLGMAETSRLCLLFLICCDQITASVSFLLRNEIVQLSNKSSGRYLAGFLRIT